MFLALCACVLPAWQCFLQQKAHAQNLLGVWRSQVSTALGTGASETILMPNGKFSKTFRCGNLITWDTGTYSVGEGYIHFEITDHEPKVYNGKRMTWVKSETVFFKFVDQDRIQCHDRITGASWEAVRIR
jgi:hypothetical protein